MQKKSCLEKACHVCGQNFIPKISTQKYCGNICSSKNEREKNLNKVYKNLCISCGIEFESKGKPRKHCYSEECDKIKSSTRIKEINDAWIEKKSYKQNRKKLTPLQLAAFYNGKSGFRSNKKPEDYR